MRNKTVPPAVSLTHTHKTGLKTPIFKRLDDHGGLGKKSVRRLYMFVFLTKIDRCRSAKLEMDTLVYSYNYKQSETYTTWEKFSSAFDPGVRIPLLTQVLGRSSHIYNFLQENEAPPSRAWRVIGWLNRDTPSVLNWRSLYY